MHQEQFCHLENGIKLCYHCYGNPQHPALLLIAGLGQQLYAWPKSMIDLFVAQDLFVISFDNRDAGRSSRIDQAPPTVLQQLMKKPSEHGYRLEDMAKDAIGLLQHLNVQAAHIMGMSMGGMIAQIIASRFPQHTLSLTSIFSTTGNPKVGQPAFKSMLLLVKPPARNKQQSILRFKTQMRSFGPSRYAMSEQELTNYAALAWDRGQGKQDGDAIARQIAAILRSGDRTESLKKIQAATLIIHADDDVLVNISGGKATHQAIAHSKLVIMHGMGHYLPQALLPELADLIGGHIQRQSYSAQKLKQTA